jgi:hypothetical protein
MVLSGVSLNILFECNLNILKVEYLYLVLCSSSLREEPFCEKIINPELNFTVLNRCGPNFSKKKKKKISIETPSPNINLRRISELKQTSRKAGRRAGGQADRHDLCSKNV